MNLRNIPKELQSLHQWVCSDSNSKVPMMATSPSPASSTNPSSWSTFQEATMSVECGNYDSVGFVFNDNGIVGIDIDDGRDEDGFLSPIAVDIISMCKSYTEKSRSGRGFHILVKGTLPFKGKNNLKGVEIYKQSRYFIMTGDVTLHKELIENQEAIDYIVEKYFPNVVKMSDKPMRETIYTPIWNKPNPNGKIPLRPLYKPIPDGTRNLSLTSLAGQLHNIGYSKENIYHEISYANTIACKPPLSNSEIISIVNSVTRYRR